MGYLGATSFHRLHRFQGHVCVSRERACQQCLTHLWVLLAEYESSFLSKIAFLSSACIYLIWGSFFCCCCGGYIWRYDSINELCPTWRSELIVALHTDPRSVWCVKSIYLNLFASIGIWQCASCFHLMFFVLNTDKQACFCALPSFGLCLLQPIFCSVDFEMKEGRLYCV